MENTEVVKGGGIIAAVNGQRVAVGNIALMEKEKWASAEAQADAARLKDGNSLVLTAVDGRLKIMMGIRDQIRWVLRRAAKTERIR